MQRTIEQVRAEIFNAKIDFVNCGNEMNICLSVSSLLPTIDKPSSRDVAACSCVSPDQGLGTELLVDMVAKRYFARPNYKEITRGKCHSCHLFSAGNHLIVYAYADR